MKTAEIRETEKWWSQLSEATQIEINGLYNVESETSKAEKNGVELLPIATYGQFTKEEKTKLYEWINNDYWLQGFTKYLINHETYFIGHLPLVREVSNQYQCLRDEFTQAYKLAKPSFSYLLEDVCHITKIRIPPGQDKDSWMYQKYHD